MVRNRIFEKKRIFITPPHYPSKNSKNQSKSFSLLHESIGSLRIFFFWKCDIKSSRLLFSAICPVERYGFSFASNRTFNLDFRLFRDVEDYGKYYTLPISWNFATILLRVERAIECLSKLNTKHTSSCLRNYHTQSSIVPRMFYFVIETTT